MEIYTKKESFMAKDPREVEATAPAARSLNVLEASIEDLSAVLMGRLITARSGCGTFSCGTFSRRLEAEEEATQR
jgi:hypothetical protein